MQVVPVVAVPAHRRGRSQSRGERNRVRVGRKGRGSRIECGACGAKVWKDAEEGGHDDADQQAEAYGHSHPPAGESLHDRFQSNVSLCLVIPPPPPERMGAKSIESRVVSLIVTGADTGPW